MIHIADGQFQDEHGRTLLLRGVNLGGSSKVPYRPNGATYVREGFFDHRNVSFVGRPFPLEQADEHLTRLRTWGLTFLRFLVPWEAVEHAGPGVYDEEYLDFLHAVVRKADEHGLQLFIDPHQDVWSRLSGGDGAPGWTFEAIGMDVTRFAETGAAIVHATHGDPFPRMIWPTNYGKLAAATMFTLFFGGNDFASKTLVDGEPAQEYLQRHYMDAMKQVARRLKDLPNVVGYDTLNEPSNGYIGCADLNSNTGGLLRLGDSPTPLQGMWLGAGIPQDVEVWDLRVSGARLLGRRRVNPSGVRVWQDGRECVWKENGVWGLDAQGAPQLLRPDHFVQVNGQPVDFANDYLRPFANRYAREIRSVDPKAVIFVESVPGQSHLRWGPQDAPHVVHAAHWYDGLTLFTKSFRSWLNADLTTGKLVFGSGRVLRMFSQQLAKAREWSLTQMCGAPTLIGEVGIPFDMGQKRAYRTGDFSGQTRAMDANLCALEANLLSYTLWNYTADNSNDRGDQWNDEDLSIYSSDQRRDPSDIHSGGRALAAVVRPYACKVAGEPLRMSFDRRARRFEFEFRHDPQVQAPTEVFVPGYQYPDGCAVEVSDGTYELDQANQLLLYRCGAEREVHCVRITPLRRSG